jgi:hypothetical protein
MDEQLARLRTHRNNILRYRNLLKMKLMEHERRYLERVLAEEQLAVEAIKGGPSGRRNGIYGHRLYTVEAIAEGLGPGYARSRDRKSRYADPMNPIEIQQLGNHSERARLVPGATKEKQSL